MRCGLEAQKTIGNHHNFVGLYLSVSKCYIYVHLPPDPPHVRQVFVVDWETVPLHGAPELGCPAAIELRGLLGIISPIQLDNFLSYEYSAWGCPSMSQPCLTIPKGSKGYMVDWCIHVLLPLVLP